MAYGAVPGKLTVPLWTSRGPAQCAAQAGHAEIVLQGPHVAARDVRVDVAGVPVDVAPDGDLERLEARPEAVVGDEQCLRRTGTSRYRKADDVLHDTAGTTDRPFGARPAAEVPEDVPGDLQVVGRDDRQADVSLGLHGQRVAAVLDVGLRDLELRRSEEDGAAHADHDPAQTPAGALPRRVVVGQGERLTPLRVRAEGDLGAVRDQNPSGARAEEAGAPGDLELIRRRVVLDRQAAEQVQRAVARRRDDLEAGTGERGDRRERRVGDRDLQAGQRGARLGEPPVLVEPEPALYGARRVDGVGAHVDLDLEYVEAARCLPRHRLPDVVGELAAVEREDVRHQLDRRDVDVEVVEQPAGDRPAGALGFQHDRFVGLRAAGAKRLRQVHVELQRAALALAQYRVGVVDVEGRAGPLQA
jgi:hypothetical protein